MEKNWIIHLVVRVLIYATVLFVCAFALMGCNYSRRVKMDTCYVSETYVLDKGCIYVIDCKAYHSNSWSEFNFYIDDCDYLELRDKITIEKVASTAKNE